MALLEMKDICKSFSGVYVNDHVSLTVDKGEIHALLGENGAGKTTLMNILYGLYDADSGEIFWKGEKTAFRTPREAIAAGIGMVQQHFSLVRNMTVLDNVILNLSGNSMFLNRKKECAKLKEMADRYGLSVDTDARIADLSVGERQRVEILKALYRNVELLILDEPTGVLTPQETEHFFAVLKELKAEGYGIIIITHRMSEIMQISDRVSVLRDGKMTASMKTSETDPAQLSRYMIGRDMKEIEAPEEKPGEEILLEVKDLSRRAGKHTHALRHIDLTVHRGEILGIAGVEGNGQKELSEVLTGIKTKATGQILMDGESIAELSVRERYEKGLAYISDDRLGDSLVPGMDITDNLILRDYRKEPYSRHGRISRLAMRENAERKMEEYEVKASGSQGIDTKVALMSGGNQQKLIAAREISDHARLVLAAQPTRGLDIGATSFVRERLLEHRKKGGGVLLISADLEEILALSDRIAVIYNGGIAGIMDRSEADVHTIGLLMGGITVSDSKEAADEKAG
ncbi:MAG: ABC transporter ATP-binding protein [Lachnospiraceae bacterium]|nr:ABC transporter ATP-binding protein [Lachnospiraceae bacterium]